MADSSFDIVSKIDRQEVDNALGQTAREIATRFDFKGTGATIEWQGEHAIEISASADDRMNLRILKRTPSAGGSGGCRIQPRRRLTGQPSMARPDDPHRHG